jgi:hypothetical protein
MAGLRASLNPDSPYSAYAAEAENATSDNAIAKKNTRIIFKLHSDVSYN